MSMSIFEKYLKERRIRGFSTIVGMNDADVF